MRTVEQWLDEYGESHRNAINKTLHWICVPSSCVSLIGLLWSVPPATDLAADIATAELGFPVSIRGRGLLPGDVVVARGRHGGVRRAGRRWRSSDYKACRGRCGSCASHCLRWRGSVSSSDTTTKGGAVVFKDIQFLMIGPLWLLSFIYRKLRIPLLVSAASRSGHSRIQWRFSPFFQADPERCAGA